MRRAATHAANLRGISETCQPARVCQGVCYDEIAFDTGARQKGADMAIDFNKVPKYITRELDKGSKVVQRGETGRRVMRVQEGFATMNAGRTSTTMSVPQ